MRLGSVIAFTLIVFVSAPVSVQEWTEFLSREDRFTCNFPDLYHHAFPFPPRGR